MKQNVILMERLHMLRNDLNSAQDKLGRMIQDKIVQSYVCIDAVLEAQLAVNKALTHCGFIESQEGYYKT